MKAGFEDSSPDRRPATVFPRSAPARRKSPPPAPAPVALPAHLPAAALEAAANPVMITDRTGTILWVNAAFTTLTGYQAQEALGRNARLLQSGQHPPQFYKQFWATLLSGRTWQGEFTNRRKDGKLYQDEHTITPVRAPDGTITHFLAVMRDVTARRQAEQQVERLTAQLERRVQERTGQLQAANQELEAFAYSVSHDLRAPLRHIGGFVKLLRIETGDQLSPEATHCLGRIGSSVQRMERLIEDLLNFSRLGRVELQLIQVNLSQLAEEVIHQLEPESRGRNIRWQTTGLPQVHADPALLRQVLLNLLDNALKYSRPRNPAEIHFGCQAHGPHETVLFVRDNGVGFDMRYAEQLFGVFQRLHPAEAFEGTGIGLANVRRIISRHGGRTWAQSEPERGATFYFSLPHP